MLDKGARVRVVGGRTAKGVTGTIFWVGDNKFGEGKRFGIKGDDGQTHWVASEHVEADSSPPAMVAPKAAPTPVDAPTLTRGDRVAWDASGGVERWGEVFWIGASKRGDGAVRIGVKDAGGETFWFDAQQVRVLDGPPPAAKKPAAGKAEAAPADLPASPFDDDEPPPWDDEPGLAEGSFEEAFFDTDGGIPDSDEGPPFG